MNILYLCDEYPPGRHGGIGTAVQLLAREMVLKGHRVVVAGFYDWGYGGADEFEDEGVTIYRFRRFFASGFLEKQESLPVRIMHGIMKRTGLFDRDIRKSLVRYGVFLEQLIKKHNIDIVEMPDYNDYMRFAKNYVSFPKLSVPVVVKLHGTHTYFNTEAGKETPEYIYRMERDILQQAAAVASVSRYTADKTAEYLNYGKPITVLYNGIRPPAPMETDKIPGRVIFTGSLAEKKGIYQLMKAWNIVNARLPDATLWIYGKGPVEKIKSLLNEQAERTVSFNGHVDRKELFRRIAEAMVAVFPSYAECFALAPMEAMACDTATIYTTRTSGPELIDEGVDGLLADPDDVEGLAEKIILLLTDKEANKRLAANGKEKVLTEFNIATVAEKHVVYYTAICKGKAGISES